MSFKFYNNTGQELQSNIYANMPIGSIIDWSSDAIPAGWLRCDAAAVSRTDYAELFNVIGTSYGSGNGTTTFNVPDISGSLIYAFQISKSGSNLIPVADGSVTTDKLVDGAVTAAKLASGSTTSAKIADSLADLIGLSGSSGRRVSITAPTERTNTSTGWVDVTGTSMTVPVASGSITFVALSMEVASTTNTSGFQGFRLMAGSIPGATTPGYFGFVLEPVIVETNWAGYNRYSQVIPLYSALTGTGNQIFKIQTRTTNSANTGYIRNVYMTAFNVTIS